MSTALLFFSVPCSTPFTLHRNPKPFPSLLTATKHRIAAVPRRLALSVSARAAVQLAGQAPASAREPEGLLDISQIGISDQIVSSLARRGITQLFPIQRAVLEPAMEGRDMIGRAITGSGKTLAFAIPILDKIIRQKNEQRRKRVPSALVLAPTRELARQVEREFKETAPNLSSTCVYGGIPITNQVRVLRLGMDIVVGTPGRIIDLVERGALDLSEVKFVVLDEADQMLAIGFQEDVECILGYLPSRKQCMLFSATMPSWVNDLSKKFLRNPLVIDLVGDTEQKLAEGISLYSVSSATLNKENLLPTLISKYAQGGKSIIFTRTKKDAESLSRSMGSIVGSRALHGNMQQLQRDRTLAAFRDGRFSVLVATDVAARGLDIPNVDLVVQFDLPNTSEIFVHRSGRTGRAGNKGTAVLMFTERQRRAVRTIERDLGCRFEELRGVTGGAVGKRDFSEREGDPYEQYRGTAQRTPGRYGSYGRFQESRTPRYQESRTPRYSKEGNYRGLKLPTGNNSSLKSNPSHADQSRAKRSPWREYDDFEGNRTNERNTRSDSSSWSSLEPSGTKRPSVSRSGLDDYGDILDLFKGQY